MRTRRWSFRGCGEGEGAGVAAGYQLSVISAGYRLSAIGGVRGVLVIGSIHRMG